MSKKQYKQSVTLLRPYRPETVTLSARLEYLIRDEIGNPLNKNIQMTVKSLVIHLTQLFEEEMKYGYGQSERIKGNPSITG